MYFGDKSTYMRLGSDVILKYVFYLRKVEFLLPFFIFSVQKPDTQIPTLYKFNSYQKKNLTQKIRGSCLLD